MSNVKCQIFSVLSLLILAFLGVTPALASTLSLSPSSGTFNRSCNFNIDIVLDTQGVGTDGTDAYLFFDSSKLTMNSIDTANKIYPDYPGSGVDSQNPNRILVSGLAAVGKPFSGPGKLATISFTVKDSASTGVAQMTFDFDPNDKNNTKDSNVVETGTSHETLTAVTNGNYTIGTGNCSGSTPAPTQAPGGSINPGGFVGSPGGATPSATFIPLKTLPEGGTFEMTAMIAILGSVLTVLGILGLALL